MTLIRLSAVLCGSKILSEKVDNLIAETRGAQGAKMLLDNVQKMIDGVPECLEGVLKKMSKYESLGPLVRAKVIAESTKTKEELVEELTSQ